MKVGLALSGGGSKGDFQVGAVRALVERGVHFDIIVGTSVGAVNGAKLAEGDDPSDPIRGLAGLEKIWESLRTRDSLYVDSPDLDQLNPNLRDVITLRKGAYQFTPEFNDAIPVLAQASWMLFGAGTPGMISGADILKAADVVSKAGSLLDLAPLKTMLATSLDPLKVQTSGVRLRLTAVSLDSGELRYITEDGSVIERDGRPVSDGTQISAVCQDAKVALDAANARCDELANRLADADTGPERGAVARLLAAAQQEADDNAADLAVCMQKNPPPPLRVDMTTAVLASAALPGAFGAVGMGGESYTDGGVRAYVPSQIAFDEGADEVYTIITDRLLTPRQAAHWQVPGIMMRMLDLMLAEQAYSAANAGPPDRASGRNHVICPDFLVHDTTVVDNGLIQINRDYGWMRANDVYDNVPQDSKRWHLATEIAKVRVQIWRDECAVAGQEDPTRPTDIWEGNPVPDPARQGMVDAGKQRLAALVAQRKNGSGPDREGMGPLAPGLEYFLTNSERHPWEQVPPGDAGGPARLPGRDAGSDVHVPVALEPGETGHCAIGFHNAGTTTWSDAAGYELRVLQTVPDGWQVPATVSLSGTECQPQAVARFTFDITAPGAETDATFNWQMHRNGSPFGAATTGQAITVRPGQQKACAVLAAQVAEKNRSIESLNQEIQNLQGDSSAPETVIAQLTKKMGDLEKQVISLTQQMHDLGCQ